MLASVLEKWFHLFDNWLLEKDTLFIKNLSLGQDFSKIKYVENPLKANFTPRTRRSRCKDFSRDYHAFDFSDFGVLTRNELPENKRVGRAGVSNSYHIIKLYINDDLSDITSFKKRFVTININHYPE
ncbi:hypothetical protein R6Q57_026344 [Mikania cordata]